MMFKIKESDAVAERFCHKISNGYEFVSDDREMLYTLTKGVSAMNFQHYIYYMAMMSIKRNGAWEKTNEIRMYNSVDDFVGSMRNAVGFVRAVRDYEEVKTR